VFETEFRGFRKRDVLDYIDGLRNEQQQEREAWEAERAALSEELLLEKEKAAETQKQLEEVSARLSSAEITAVTERCEALEQEKEALLLQVEEVHQALVALWNEKSEREKAFAEAEERLNRLQTLGQAVYKELAVEVDEAEEQAKKERERKQMEQWLF
jgi:hypothetical protein